MAEGAPPANTLNRLSGLSILPRRHKRKKKRFPKFFEEAVGPMASVAVPGQLTPVEHDLLDPNVRYVGDAPPSAGFPSWALLPDEEQTGLVTEIDVPFPEDVGEGAGGDDGPAPSGMFTQDESAGADAIAHYKPWHVWGEDWGIYFFAQPFRDFVAATAALSGTPYRQLEPYVMRQLLEHELTHFEFEVVGTKLEAIYGAPLYRSYLFQGFSSPTRWTGLPWAKGPHPGPAEEAIATWREVRYSRRKKPASPRGYQAAASKLADASPAGYNAWRCADTANAHLAGLVTATVASLIAHAPHVVPPAHGLDQEDLGDVPVYWRGDPAVIPSSAPAKDTTRPTPKRLEKWLKKNQAEIDRDRGKGSHVRFTWRGQSGGFSTSRDPVPAEPCKEIATLFGFTNTRDFYLAIADSRVVR
jgi:hypothetical protein